MFVAVTSLCFATLPQLQVRPYPVEVGKAATVVAMQLGLPISGLEVEVELPDGSRRSCGPTAADGTVVFHPQQIGSHVFVATVAGVRWLAPLAVAAPRRTWLMAFGTVPLGLALLWCNLSRARGRRGS